MSDSLTNYFDGLQEDLRRKQVLADALKDAAIVNPDQYAEDVRVGQAVGMTPDAVAGNKDMAKQIKYVNDAGIDRLWGGYPNTSSWLSDPENAKQASDSVQHLSGIEGLIQRLKDIPSNISSQFQIGRIQSEYGMLGQKLQAGQATEEEKARIEELDKKMQSLQNGGESTIEGSAAAILGQQYQTLPEAAWYGVTTGAGFAGIAAVAGQAGPQAVLPEEAITVPGAAILGFFSGFGSKIAEQSYKIEAGSSYIDMVKAGISKDTAAYASTGVGLVNAALEVAGVEMVAAPVKKMLVKAVEKNIIKALEVPAKKEIWKTLGKEYLKAWAGETGTEVLQEISSITGEELSRATDGLQLKIETPEGRQEIADRLVGIFEQVGMGMLTLAMPTPGLHFISQYRKANTAIRNAEFINSLYDISAETPLRARNGDAFENFISSQTNGTPVENLYVDHDKLTGILEQAGITPQQADQVVPGISKQIEDAVSTGSDVEIPTSVFASRLAGSDIGNALKVHLRISPDALSMHDASEIQAQRDQLMKDAQDAESRMAVVNSGFGESANKLKSMFKEQIKAVGIYNKSQEEAAAVYLRDLYVVKAAAMGLTPEELYNRIPYKIAGQESETPVFRGMADFLNQIVYHGSQHEFSAFDSSKIGTGEGAQVYGHGIYFAENPDVAKYYREAGKEFDMKESDNKAANALAKETLDSHSGDKSAAISSLNDLMNESWSDKNRLKKAIKVIETGKEFVIKSGNLYRVEIPDEWMPKMLDWDKPFSSQDESIKSALESLISDVDPQSIMDFMESHGKSDWESLTGREIYDLLGMDGHKASSSLSEAGIPGIKYFDGASRSEGKGSRNIVVFPGLEDQVKIIDRNGKPIDVFAQAAAHFKQAMPEDWRWRNWEPAMTSTGKIKGAPEWVVDQQGLNKMRAQLRKNVKEGLVGRFWYEDSAQAVMDLVRGDVGNAEKFIQLLAIYSPNSNVWVNTIQAVKAYTHWASGGSRESFKVGSGQGDAKAIGLLYDGVNWDGRKTNSFYLNLMHDIVAKNPDKVDQMNLDPGFVKSIEKPVTIDVWMARAFGYKLEQFADDKGTGKYSFGENEIRRLTGRLNSELSPGEPRWTPHQVQAAIWTSIKTRYEFADVKEKTNRKSMREGLIKKVDGKIVYPTTPNDSRRHLDNWRHFAMQKTSQEVSAAASANSRSFGDDLQRMTEVVTWEANPSTSFGYEINGASPEVLRQFTAEARALIIDESGNDMLAAYLGVPLSYSVQGYGAYAGAVSPNNLSHLLPARKPGQDGFNVDEVRSYARAIQYIFKQDAVPWFRPDNKSITSQKGIDDQMFRVINGKTGKAVPGAKFMTQAEAEAFAQQKGEGFSVRGGDLAKGVAIRFETSLTDEHLSNILKSLFNYLGEDAGYTRTADNEITLINFRDDLTHMPFSMSDEVFMESIQNFINNGIDTFGIVDAGNIYSQGEYGYVHNWSEDKEGAGIIEGSFSGRPDLQSWLRDRRSAFEELISRYSGDSLIEAERAAAGLRAGRLYQASVRSSSERRAPARPRALPLLQDWHGEVKAEYGERRPGVEQIIGVHFSGTQRSSLSGTYYGQGMKGEEANRLRRGDPRLSSRIHFYVDTGESIVPENGVGHDIHAVRLNNIYDIDKDVLGLKSMHPEMSQSDWMNFAEAAILDAGYDGVLVPKAQGEQGVAVLLGQDHTDVPVDYIGLKWELEDRVNSGVLRQAPIWYSPLSRGIESIKQASMTGEQWSAWLKGNSGKLGIKKDEIQWTGIDEYLSLRGKDKVSKQEILDYLKQNGVQVQEVMKGGVDDSEVAAWWNDEGGANEEKPYEELTPEERIAAAMQYQDEVGDFSDEATKYSEYTLPGGDNYRELLLTLPINQVPAPIQSKYPFTVKKISDGRIIGLQYAETKEDANNRAEKIKSEGPYDAVIESTIVLEDGPTFQSSHWSEPNILAHIRFNDRTDADGNRVLFIEEIQSDWGQKGKKEGFSAPLSEKERAHLEGLKAKNKELHAALKTADDAEFDRIQEIRKPIMREIEDLERRESAGVPSAPFVTDTKAWTALAIKRMIRYAVENGYEKVAFVNGEQSADRYDLSKKIDYISSKGALREGSRYVDISLPSGMINLIVGPDGIIESQGGSLGIAEMQGKPLSDVIGKDLSEKVMSTDDEQKFSGEGLRVGGEGMRSFYDQIVPSVAKDIIKKWGSGIEESRIPVERKTSNYDASGLIIVEADNNPAERRFLVMPKEGGTTIEAFPTKEQAESYIGGSRQLSFSITPQMRESVMSGMPLFQAVDADGSRAWFNPSSMTTILTQKADFSSFMHETAHMYLTAISQMAAMPEADEMTKADMQSILDWFGVKDLDTWNKMPLDQQRKYHEQFAYNYEIYLSEGKAPTPALRSMFQKFSMWLKRVYKSIKDELNSIYRAEHGVDLPILTGEVRQVMDRMLASDKQIVEAEKTYGLVPIYATAEESGMSPAEWAAYSDMNKEAHDAGVEAFTAASIRQMKWLGNAESRMIKEMQREVADVRSEMRIEVAKEVADDPLYKAIRSIKQSETSMKLNTQEVEAMFPKKNLEKLGSGRYGMMSVNGMSVDFLADTYGFDSGKSFVEAVLSSKPESEEVDARTDARMLQEHSDLMDPKERQKKINEALHNEARTRFVAVELRHIMKTHAPARVIVQAAREAAAAIISSKRIKDIKPGTFAVTEGKMSRLSYSLLKKGDIEGSVDAKRKQLLQSQMVREGLAANQEIEKQLKRFSKLFRNDKRLAGKMDMDLVDVARSILGYYDLGPKGKNPMLYIEKLKSYNPDLYAELEPMVLEAATNGKPYVELTLEEFRGLSDAIETLVYQSVREKEVVVSGKRMALDNVVSELMARLEDIGIPESVPGEKGAPSKKDKAARVINSGKALLRRVEAWADATDGAHGPGAFTNYIWRVVRDATDEYRSMRNIYTKRYVDLVSGLDLPVRKIEASELGYVFGSGNGGIGKAELLGAMLHTGNESNYRKLLLGRGWASINEDGTLNDTMWKHFEERMISEGVLTKSDYDFVQAVWDLNEEMKPMAQRAHRELYGFYFKEVPSRAISNKLGDWGGGYVPAKTDPFMVRDARQQAGLEQLESDFRNSMPSTGLGFTKGRVEYNKPLSLDVRVIAKHIDDVLRFVNIQPAVKDVMKIIRNRDFADAITRLDPGAIEGMLIPWLNRAARQVSSEPGKFALADKFWNAVRSRTGVSVMFANLTNALQQVTGLSISMLKVDGKHLRGGIMQYIADPKGVVESICEKSKFMDNHLKNQIFDIAQDMNDLVMNPSKFDKVQAWARHHGYFLQSAFQHLVDVVTWVGSYNQNLEITGDEAEAVKRADAAVRETQGTRNPEDIAAYEVGTPFVNSITQFSGYFNMLANVNATEFVKIARDLGWRGNKGKLFMTYMLGFAIPTLVSEAIVRAMNGKWQDDDDDGYLDEFMDWFFGGQLRGLAAMVPVGGSAALVIPNALNNKAYDDRLTTSPSVSALEASTIGAVRAAQAAIDPDKEVSGKNIRDILTLLSLVTGTPVSALGRPIGYARDVSRGAVNPENPIDFARGLITGAATPVSKK